MDPTRANSSVTGPNAADITLLGRLQPRLLPCPRHPPPCIGHAESVIHICKQHSQAQQAQCTKVSRLESCMRSSSSNSTNLAPAMHAVAVAELVCDAVQESYAAGAVVMAPSV